MQQVRQGNLDISEHESWVASLPIHDSTVLAKKISETSAIYFAQRKIFSNSCVPPITSARLSGNERKDEGAH